MGGLLSSEAGDTELDRSRTEGDFVDSEVVAIKKFFARAVLIQMSDDAGKDATPIQKLLKMCVYKMQPLTGRLIKLDLRKNLLKKLPPSIKNVSSANTDCEWTVSSFLRSSSSNNGAG